MRRTSTLDTRIAVAFFVIVSSIYFATVVGVTSSNDGSHYALVRAIVERRGFEISPWLDFTEHQDYALRGDLRFSDRPPGTALAASPLYAASRFLPEPLIQPPSKHDAGNPRMLYAVLLSPLAAGGAVTLFYLTLRHHFDRSPFAAIITTTALAFGTTTWKYGSVLYSHALAGLVVWGAIYLILKSWKEPLSLPAAFALGFLVGCAPLIEYTNVPLSVALGSAWLLGLRPITQWLRPPAHRPAMLASPLAFALGGLIPIAFLLIYNTLNFGSPFELSTFNVDTTRWPQNEGMAADFATPLWAGLTGLLFYGAENQGLFLLMPVTLISLLGLWSFIRFSPRRAALILGVFLMMLVIFAKSTTFNAATNDGRYLTPFIGLWLIPLAFWIDDRYLSDRGDTSYLLRSLLLAALLFLSIRNQMVHIVFSWNYDLDPARLNRMSVSPENVSYFLRTLLPNAANLPLLWLGEGIALGLMTLAHRWRQASQAAISRAPALTGSALES